MSQLAMTSILPTSDSSTATQPRKWNGLPILAGVLLVCYAAYLLSLSAPAIVGVDDNGYFAQGSLLAKTGKLWIKPQSDAQYLGMHWLLTPNGYYVSRYPPGLAAFVAIAYELGGYRAALLVNPLFAVITVVALFQIVRRYLHPGWALLACACLVVNPIFAEHATSGDSHIGVAACLTVGLLLLLNWARDQKLSQAFFAGLVLGIIPTIRYPDSILAFGVVVFFLWSAPHDRRMFRHVLAAALGALLPILPMLICNQMMLGAFWRTGYSLTAEQTGFSWNYFTQHALEYIQQIHGGGLGWFFALGLLGMACMCCVRATRPLGAMLSLQAVPMLLLYMAYYWAPNQAQATMRFLVPTFPLYTLAGVWLVALLVRSLPKPATIVLPVLILTVQILWGGIDAMQSTGQQRRSKQSLAAVTEALDRTAGANDVVVADPQVLQDLDFVRHWKLADASLVNGGGGMFGGGGGPPGMGGGGGFGRGMMGGGGRMNGRPDGMGGGGRMNGRPDGMGGTDQPSPQQAAKRQAQQKLYPGTQQQKAQKFAADLQTWASGGTVYLVGTEQSVRNLIGTGQVTIVQRVTLPQQPQEQMNDRRDGFGAPPGMGGGMGGPGGGPGGGGPMMGGRAMRGGPGGGGPGAMNAFAGATEAVIAKWTPGNGQTNLQPEWGDPDAEF